MCSIYFWHAYISVQEYACFLLLVTWEESLDLLDDGQVTGAPLSLACLTPVSDKLFYRGLQLVQVKCGGWSDLFWILLRENTSVTHLLYMHSLNESQV